MALGRSNSSDGTQVGPDADPWNLEHKARLLDSLPECIFLVDAATTCSQPTHLRSQRWELFLAKPIGGPVSVLLKSIEDSDGRPLDIDVPVGRTLISGDAETLDVWYEHGLSTPDGEPHKVLISVLPSPADSQSGTVALL
jgi:hypothetical protein